MRFLCGTDFIRERRKRRSCSLTGRYPPDSNRSRGRRSREQRQAEEKTHAQKKKPPFPAASIQGPLLLRLQLVRDELELGVEGRTDQVHRRDDHNRNASGDETVFDRGRAGLVLQKRNKL